MKVLFVSSGNSPFGISPIVKSQGESLEKKGIEIEYFTIIGKGVIGYLKNIFKLKRFLKNNLFDIIHAHYSLSGYVASSAGARPLVVSLMGSDVQFGILRYGIIKLFNKFFWDKLIVKSKYMKEKVGIRKSHVIPNGVDFNFFKSIDKRAAKEIVRFNPCKKHIIFIADPKRPEKNVPLANRAFRMINHKNVDFHIVYGVSYKMIPFYIYAADVLLLTSLREGSPNVVKEAMACNCPIVSTDVGDVKEVIRDTKGCYISTFEPKDVAEKLIRALEFGSRTKGREVIGYLNKDIIAKKILDIYQIDIK